MSRLKQDFTTKVSLAPLAEKYGALWAQCYIEVAPLTIKALPALRKLNVKEGAEDLTDLEDEDITKVTTMVKAAFISGKVVLKGKVVDAEPDDIEDMPMEVLNDIITAATGKTSPKS